MSGLVGSCVLYLFWSEDLSVICALFVFIYLGKEDYAIIINRKGRMVLKLEIHCILHRLFRLK